jgi:hypothetical protein
MRRHEQDAPHVTHTFHWGVFRKEADIKLVSFKDRARGAYFSAGRAANKRNGRGRTLTPTSGTI